MGVNVNSTSVIGIVDYYFTSIITKITVYDLATVYRLPLMTARVSPLVLTIEGKS